MVFGLYRVWSFSNSLFAIDTETLKPFYSVLQSVEVINVQHLFLTDNVCKVFNTFGIERDGIFEASIPRRCF